MLDRLFLSYKGQKNMNSEDNILGKKDLYDRKDYLVKLYYGEVVLGNEGITEFGEVLAKRQVLMNIIGRDGYAKILSVIVNEEQFKLMKENGEINEDKKGIIFIVTNEVLSTPFPKIQFPVNLEEGWTKNKNPLD